MKPTMTLDRVLSRFGIASRTVARAGDSGGAHEGQRPHRARPRRLGHPGPAITFLFDGQRLKPARKRYLLFYKPKGVITSHGDPAGRETIYKYLGEENKWVVARGPPGQGYFRPAAADQ